VFESSPDLYWLFVKLLLANWEVFDWTISRHLTDLVAEPIWGSLWGHPSYELNKQAASYVDDQKYHCTTLRDFFITEMLDCLFPDQPEPKRGRLWYVFWVTVVTSFIFTRGWGFFVSLLVLVFIIRGEVNSLTLRRRVRQFIK
jgi:hypothetical protein